MSTMGERIAMVIEDANIKKVQFAEAIKVDQSFVSQLVAGKRNPSDRTIRDICREYGISREWLVDGKGEMKAERSESDELDKIFAEIGASDDELVKAAIRVYWRLDEKEKAAIRKLTSDLAEELSKKKSPGA